MPKPPDNHSRRALSVLVALSLAVAVSVPAMAQSPSQHNENSSDLQGTSQSPIVRKDRPLPYDKTEDKTPKTEFNPTGKKSGANAAEDCYPGAKDKTNAKNARNDDSHCK